MSSKRSLVVKYDNALLITGLAEVGQTSATNFAVANKEGNVVKQMSAFMKCREFLNETIAVGKHMSFNKYSFYWNHKKQHVQEDATILLLKVANSPRFVQAAKNLLHYYERRNGYVRTKITQVNLPDNDYSHQDFENKGTNFTKDWTMYVIEGDKRWMESATLASLYTALLRFAWYADALKITTPLSAARIINGVSDVAKYNDKHGCCWHDFKTDEKTAQAIRQGSKLYGVKIIDVLMQQHRALSKDPLGLSPNSDKLGKPPELGSIHGGIGVLSLLKQLVKIKKRSRATKYQKFITLTALKKQLDNFYGGQWISNIYEAITGVSTEEAVVVPPNPNPPPKIPTDVQIW